MLIYPPSVKRIKRIYSLIFCYYFVTFLHFPSLRNLNCLGIKEEEGRGRETRERESGKREMKEGGGDPFADVAASPDPMLSK